MARLYLGTDPDRALYYAKKSTDNGDTLGFSVLAEVLDYVSGSSIDTPSLISTSRVQLISQIIVKLDPSFASNVGSCANLEKSGFIRFITGLYFLYFSVYTMRIFRDLGEGIYG